MLSIFPVIYSCMEIGSERNAIKYFPALSTLSSGLAFCMRSTFFTLFIHAP